METEKVIRKTIFTSALKKNLSSALPVKENISAIPIVKAKTQSSGNNPAATTSSKQRNKYSEPTTIRECLNLKLGGGIVGKLDIHKPSFKIDQNGMQRDAGSTLDEDPVSFQIFDPQRTFKFLLSELQSKLKNGQQDSKSLAIILTEIYNVLKRMDSCNKSMTSSSGTIAATSSKNCVNSSSQTCELVFSKAENAHNCTKEISNLKLKNAKIKDNYDRLGSHYRNLKTLYRAVQNEKIVLSNALAQSHKEAEYLRGQVSNLQDFLSKMALPEELANMTSQTDVSYSFLRNEMRQDGVTQTSRLGKMEASCQTRDVMDLIFADLENNNLRLIEELRNRQSSSVEYDLNEINIVIEERLLRFYKMVNKLMSSHYGPPHLPDRGIKFPIIVQRKRSSYSIPSPTSLHKRRPLGPVRKVNLVSPRLMVNKSTEYENSELEREKSSDVNHLNYVNYKWSQGIATRSNSPAFRNGKVASKVVKFKQFEEFEDDIIPKTKLDQPIKSILKNKYNPNTLEWQNCVHIDDQDCQSSESENGDGIETGGIFKLNWDSNYVNSDGTSPFSPNISTLVQPVTSSKRIVSEIFLPISNYHASETETDRSDNYSRCSTNGGGDGDRSISS